MTDIKRIRELLSKCKTEKWVAEEWNYQAIGWRVTSDPWLICDVRKDLPNDESGQYHAELIATLRNEIGPLLDRVEAMEANARRYEHLREYGCWLDPSKYAKAKRVLDAAIDADIAALRGKGE